MTHLVAVACGLSPGTQLPLHLLQVSSEYSTCTDVHSEFHHRSKCSSYRIFYVLLPCHARTEAKRRLRDQHAEKSLRYFLSSWICFTPYTETQMRQRYATEVCADFRAVNEHLKDRDASSSVGLVTSDNPAHKLAGAGTSSRPPSRGGKLQTRYPLVRRARTPKIIPHARPTEPCQRR